MKKITIQLKDIATCIVCLFVLVGLAGCESNATGTYVPVGKDDWSHRELVLDTRNGQVWVLEKAEGEDEASHKYVKRYWIIYSSPIESQDEGLWNRFAQLFKNQKLQFSPLPSTEMPGRK